MSLPMNDIVTICEKLLGRSMALTGATFGNVQLVDWRSGELRIVAHHGFLPEFLRYFARVKYDDTCACARVLAGRDAIFISDVMVDAAFAPYRGMAERAGFRAVQSTPLLSASSAFVGVVSTHFPTVHTPTAATLASVGGVARSAASAVISARAQARKAHEMVEAAAAQLLSAQALLSQLR